MTQGPIWYIWGNDAFNPLDTGFIFSISSVRVYWQHYGIMGGRIVMKFSGYGHKEQLSILFYS